MPDIEIRLLGAADADALENVDPDVFDGPPIPRWTAAFLADPAHVLAVALDAARVVGMASAVRTLHPDKPPELWVNEVGVASGYRGRGLGRALLRALFDHGRQLGCAEAWVLTEPDNAPARALYARAGGLEQAPPVYVTFRLDDAP